MHLSIMTDHIIYPAYLCVTPDPIAEEQLHLFLQTFLCTNKQCGQCQNCIKIKEHQHPSALWVTPKNK